MIIIKKNLIKIKLKGMYNTNNGSALVLEAGGKKFFIYVESTISDILILIINRISYKLPLAYDIITNLFRIINIDLICAIFNQIELGIFFARIYLKLENIYGIQIIELDTRPTDVIILAIHMKKDVYITPIIEDYISDLSEILYSITRERGRVLNED